MSVRTPLVAPKKAPVTREVKRQERLAERRRRIRRIEKIILSGLALSLIGGLVWVLWLPSIRAAEIEVIGEQDIERAVAIETLTQNSITGFYGFVLPRDSIFLIPEEDIRTSILNEYPDIAAVSVERESFSSLSVTVFPRVAAFTWCGAAIEFPQPCFLADSEGLLFEEAASSTESLLTFYAPLEDGVNTEHPLRGRVAGAMEKTPSVFQFIRTIGELGLSANAVVLRGDEADIYLRGTDTRITYVLGDEQGASALVAITLKNLSVPIESFEYIDVRFHGKAYFKKKE